MSPMMGGVSRLASAYSSKRRAASKPGRPSINVDPKANVRAGAGLRKGPGGMKKGAKSKAFGAAGGMR